VSDDLTPEQKEKQKVLRRQRREARIAAAKERQQKIRWISIAVGSACFASTFLLVYFTGILEPAPIALPDTAAVASIRPKSPASRPVPTDPDRPVFRYSIVPGGLRSASEVKLAMQNDPVVARHYAGIEPALLRSERLTAPMTAHVSYRIGDKVYWTKKKLTLNAGEKVLTDGTVTMRERCGNLISMDPLAPAMEGAEPAPPEFDMQVEPYIPTAGVELADPPDPPGFFVAPRGGLPPGDPPDVDITPLSESLTVVPEPSTWTMLVIGLGAGAAYLRKRKQRQEPS
jgi:hypothetical protein